MKRAAVSLLFLLVLGGYSCRSADQPKPKTGPDDACACVKPLKAALGDPAFLTERKAFVACFLNAKAKALGGQTVACTTSMQDTLTADVAQMKAQKADIETMLPKAGEHAVPLLQQNRDMLAAALDLERQFVGDPPPQATCNCGGKSVEQLQREFAAPDAASTLVTRRQELATCITTLRDQALQRPAALPCAGAINALEAIALDDAKQLAARRQKLATDIAASDQTEGQRLFDQLQTVNAALAALQPLVDVPSVSSAASDITLRKTVFASARETFNTKQEQDEFDQRCISEYAYLDIPKPDDEKPDELIRCVARMREHCRDASKEDVNRCERDVARLEDKLREMGASKFEALQELKAVTSPNDEQKDAIDTLSKHVAAIGKVVIVPGSGVLPEYSDYPQWWSKFALGYEYVKLNRAFTSGHPRLGAVMGLSLPRQAVPDSSRRNWHPVSYGVFLSFALGLTNTAEQTKTSIPLISGGSAVRPFAVQPTTDPNDGDTPEPKNTLAFEQQIFWPWWRSDLEPEGENRRQRTWFGPVAVLGGMKADESDDGVKQLFITPRFYGGVRFARSPEMFGDFMYGRSGGWSRRGEIRGQMPLPHRFNNGARIVIGGGANFGVNKRKRGRGCPPDDAAPCMAHAAEPDVIRFYLSYDIEWSDLLKYFTK